MPELLRPRTLDEAADLIARHGAALTILAGGTSVLPRLDRTAGGVVLATSALGLDQVTKTGDGWQIGAAVSLSKLRAAVTLPAMQAATREVGGPAIQNMATVGGNLFAHEPYGDVAVALLALGATLRFATADGERTREIGDFYAAWRDGAPPETGLLTRIDLAAPAGAVAYTKCARRRFASPSVVTVAAMITSDGGTVRAARIALGGATAHPMRCAPAEEAVIGSKLDAGAIARAAAAAAASVTPRTDTIATDWYRKRMTGVFVGRALQQCAPLGA